ncbi:MAG: malonic semialdehyde reductase [Alphaproteobacteria bacterium]|nr:MAG: malonic semialdehyde reductase [Alphaproteobacteria bacterium]
MTNEQTATILHRLFYDARTHNGWQKKTIPTEILHELYDAMRYAPTSANCSPLRIVFVTSDEEKAKLSTCLMEGNQDKTRNAPLCALLAMDMAFYERLPQLFPHTDARSWFVGNDALISDTAFRNSSLQAAYFIMAARALGLDCGPMSGFDADAVNAMFFAGTSLRINMMCNLGYGDTQALHPRSPRLSFDEACRII